jgi:hypothetical protein
MYRRRRLLYRQLVKIVNKEPVNDPNKTQIREDFRQKMANLLIDPPTAQTDKV